MIGIFSKGILKTVPNLEEFLEEKIVLNPKSPNGLRAIAGWGYKDTARKAIEKAKEWGLPYLALEDGFIFKQVPPVSLIIDPIGIYYDATKPSLLENLLNSDDWVTDEIMDKAKKFLKIILKYKITKYNYNISLPRDYFPKAKERVLLIDQTYGDYSVKLGMADELSFKRMLDIALKEHSCADIYIKVHPEVISGRKQGYLVQLKFPKNVKLIKECFNPYELFENFDVIYTVTSQMGFEALLAGREVRTFGIPFYAGWGLTKDEMVCERRKRRIEVLKLFSASYMIYPKYLPKYLKFAQFSVLNEFF